MCATVVYSTFAAVRGEIPRAGEGGCDGRKYAMAARSVSPLLPLPCLWVTLVHIRNTVRIILREMHLTIEIARFRLNHVVSEQRCSLTHNRGEIIVFFCMMIFVVYPGHEIFHPGVAAMFFSHQFLGEILSIQIEKPRKKWRTSMLLS